MTRIRWCVLLGFVVFEAIVGALAFGQGDPRGALHATMIAFVWMLGVSFGRAWGREREAQLRDLSLDLAAKNRELIVERTRRLVAVAVRGVDGRRRATEAERPVVQGALF